MWSYAQLHVNGWTEDPESDRRKGVDLTRRALQISPDDPDVLAIAAFVLGYFRKGHRCSHRADRPLSRPKPELCSRLVCQRATPAFCRSTQRRARAFRYVPAPQPTRSTGILFDRKLAMPYSSIA